MDRLQCSNCNSFKLKVYSRQYKFVIGILLTALGFLLSLTWNTENTLILVAIVGYGMIPVGLTYIILGITHSSTKVVCKSCNNEWRIYDKAK